MTITPQEKLEVGRQQEETGGLSKREMRSGGGSSLAEKEREAGMEGKFGPLGWEEDGDWSLDG